MKTLALDPAKRTGFWHSDGHHGVWDLGHRDDCLLKLRELLHRAHREWGFERLAFEDAQLGSHNFTVQGQHAELRGVIKLVAAELSVETIAVNPASLKSFATGSGRAKKWQMVRAAKTFFGVDGISDDEADARFVLEYAKQGIRPLTPPKKTKRAPRGRRKETRLF